MARYATARYSVKEAREATWARRVALFFVQLMILTVLLHRFASLTTPAAMNLLAVSLGGLFLAIGIALFAIVRIWFGGQTRRRARPWPRSSSPASALPPRFIISRMRPPCR